MKLPLIVLLCAYSLVASSQRVNVLYYNDEGLTTDVNTSTYYVVDSTWADWSRSSHAFYRSGKRKYEEKRGPKPVYRTTYYESGGIATEGFRHLNANIGLVSAYYENGKPMADVYFPTEPSGKVTIEQYWDSLGNKIIDNGNGKGFVDLGLLEKEMTPGTGEVLSGRKHGTWKGSLPEGGQYEERYDNGKLISGTQQRDGKTYNYTALQVQAEPNGGMRRLTNFLLKEVKYPREAQRNKVQGKVLVEFVVDETGNVSNPRVIKGISPECDAECLRVVALTKWTPGLKRGAPTKTRCVLPIDIKL